VAMVLSNSTGEDRSCYPVDLLLRYCRENQRIKNRLSGKRRKTWQRKKDAGTAAAPRLW
jgi:hypothetical protein